MLTREFWNLRVLLTCNVSAVVLFASWFFEPTRLLWIEADTAVFWAMNNSLKWGGEVWQWVWAIANNRAFDLVAAIGMTSVFIHYAVTQDGKNIHQYVAVLIFAGLTALLSMEIGTMIPIERISATKEFSGVVLLSELVTEISTKDSSGDSFPGDHGIGLFVFAGFALFYLSLKHGLIAVFFAILFGLPRLMSGAHWLSDELVGALSIVIIVLSWIFATPLHRTILYWLESGTYVLCKRLSRICVK